MISVRLRVISAVMTTCLLTAAGTQATTILVPTDVSTIQGGLNIATVGDTVAVEPGVYLENLLMPTAVVLLGLSGPDVTVVDGQSVAPVVTCHGIVAFTIADLTLRHGVNSPGTPGGGISILEASGEVTGCHLIENHTAGADGGGIGVTSSTAFIRECVFIDNESDVSMGLDGGGVFAWNSNLVLENSIFDGNRADEGGAFAVTQQTTATIRGCLVVRCEATGPGVAGSGIVATLSTLLLENNTFFENITNFQSGCLAFAQGGNVEIHNNIVAGSTGYGVHTVSPINLGCNDICASGNANYMGVAPGPGDISADPQFCMPSMMDFSLHSSSPCAPANNPCGLVGAYDVGCGPVAVEPTSWGRIKNQFRDGDRR